MSRVFLVVGAGFGDEGKGATCDHLVRKHRASLVVRYNGGAQAGHNVVLKDGRAHTFAQFGSGTFAGARTHLSRFVMVDPITMVVEAGYLNKAGVPDALSSVTIERDALITTPFHISLNRIRELSRRKNTKGHGSCGMGIGETATFAKAYPDQAIRAADLSQPDILRAKLENLQQTFFKMACLCDPVMLEPDTCLMGTRLQDRHVLQYPEYVDSVLVFYRNFLTKGVQVVDADFLPSVLRDTTAIFEGAQGTLLDEQFGFHPYTTHSNCTFRNAETLLSDYKGDVRSVAVLRAYHTRHGAGPFPTESSDLRLTERHNQTTLWQQDFRVGYLDLVLVRYARRILGQVDEIALNHLDEVEDTPLVCTHYVRPWGDQVEIFPVTRAEYEQELQKTGTAYKHPLEERVIPQYEELTGVEEIVGKIEANMRASVTIRGYGPTAEDRKP